MVFLRLCLVLEKYQKKKKIIKKNNFLMFCCSLKNIKVMLGSRKVLRKFSCVWLYYIKYEKKKSNIVKLIRNLHIFKSYNLYIEELK